VQPAAVKTLEQQIAEDAEAEKQARAPTEDKLEKVRNAVRAARDLRLEIDDLEGQLKLKRAELVDLQYRQLPEVFARNGVNTIELAKQGNMPAYVAKLSDHYRASISSEWDQERQDRAFDYLERTGRGDIVKRTITVSFGRDSENLFSAFYEYVTNFTIEERRKTETKVKVRGKIRTKIKTEKVRVKPSLDIDLKRTVAWNTLTAMVKNHYEDGDVMGSDELETLGATVGQVVKINEVKEK
jgi:hypothetical protein